MNLNDIILHPASFQERLPEKKVRCLLCPNYCLIREGGNGICRTRVNINGELFTLAYGNPCSFCIDPIEKKPLFHFLPGTGIFSVATAGCNFRCLNCQNWEISQSSPLDLRQYELEPEDVVKQALAHNIKSIAFTYTEPTVFYEYVYDIARLAHENGLKTVFISNGFINKMPLLELIPFIDAANIDLKCFDDEVYKKLTGGRLKPVLETIESLKNNGVWLEITNLMIPGFSDKTDMIKTMCEWLFSNGFSDTPVHFSRFFPNFRLQATRPTNEKDLINAKEIAEKSGIRFVYIGNIPGLSGENTFCPNCKHLLVERTGFIVRKNLIKDGHCSYCGNKIAGVWE
jgi:pyruvate formate lyase activating enzyme